MRHMTFAISWECIATETASDPTMRLLLDTIQEGFPDDRSAANDDIAAFWTYHDTINVTGGVILYRDRVVVPPSLGDKNTNKNKKCIYKLNSLKKICIYKMGDTNTNKNKKCRPIYNLNSLKKICIYKTQKRLTIIQYKVINIQTIGVGGSY